MQGACCECWQARQLSAEARDCYHLFNDLWGGSVALKYHPRANESAGANRDGYGDRVGSVRTKGYAEITKRPPKVERVFRRFLKELRSLRSIRAKFWKFQG